MAVRRKRRPGAIAGAVGAWLVVMSHPAFPVLAKTRSSETLSGRSVSFAEYRSPIKLTLPLFAGDWVQQQKEWQQEQDRKQEQRKLDDETAKLYQQTPQPILPGPLSCNPNNWYFGGLALGSVGLAGVGVGGGLAISTSQEALGLTVLGAGLAMLVTGLVMGVHDCN